MNKNVKKVLFLLIICIFILLIYKIIDIYAVFHSEMDAYVKLENGIWNITVNGEKITTGVETEFTIDEITATQDIHVKPGRLAPGLSGSFEIAINPENTDVSVRYDITLNQEKLENSNVKIKSIEEIEKNYPLIKTSENTYTGIISLDDIKKGVIHKIKMEVEWVDDEKYNENDTKLGSSSIRQFQIPIKVHAIQYLGEEIIPVIED